MIENFPNVEAEIYGGVPDVPLKITCSLNVDASFWLQMFSANLMLHRISMQFLMMGNASKNSKYHWIPLLNFAHNVWCSIFFFGSVQNVHATCVCGSCCQNCSQTKQNLTWRSRFCVFFSTEKISLDKCWENRTGTTAPISFYRGSC